MKLPKRLQMPLVRLQAAATRMKRGKPKYPYNQRDCPLRGHPAKLGRAVGNYGRRNVRGVWMVQCDKCGYSAHIVQDKVMSHLLPYFHK